MFFIDLNGDTITVSKKLSQTEAWNRWRNSEEGKAFYKIYEADGERGTTLVHFSLFKNIFGVEITDGWSRMFTFMFLRPGHTILLKDGQPVEEFEKGLITSGGENLPHKPDPNSIYSFHVKLDVFNEVFRDPASGDSYSTITHEIDHVIYMDSQVRKGKTIIHPDEQHKPNGPVPKEQGGKQLRQLVPSIFNKK